MAGLGSYFSPWVIDTNDLLLEAVPQTPLASAFIELEWITFVARLNTQLRTIQYDGIQIGACEGACEHD